jgi:hypothetical protein
MLKEEREITHRKTELVLDALAESGDAQPSPRPKTHASFE